MSHAHIGWIRPGFPLPSNINTNILKHGNAKCILGYFTVLSPHKSPLMQTRWSGRVKNASRTLPSFTTVLGLCVLGIGTVLGLRLMTSRERPMRPHIIIVNYHIK